MKSESAARYWRRTTLFPGYALAMLGGVITGCGLNVNNGLPPLKVVDSVDVERYMGRWYEIAKYPNRFERGCYGVTADYALRRDGKVSVVNTCRSSDGRRIRRTIRGFATIEDKTSNAKLKVYFFYPFGAPYWIIDLDPAYRYAVVSEPTRNYLWILSRTPTMDGEVYAGVLNRLTQMGFNVDRLERMTQFEEIQQ